MKISKYKLAALGAAVVAPLLTASAQVRLTDIVVFSASNAGTYDGSPFAWYIWNSRPNDVFANVWVKGASGFLTGSADANVQPNITLAPGVNSFTLYMTGGGSGWPNMGINLFLNGASAPSISAFGPEQTTAALSSFAANSSTQTPNEAGYNGLVHGAGTLSFVSGDQLVTLTGFSLAYPSVYNQDLVGPSSIAPDGNTDYIGHLELTVTTVPEPALSLWALGGLIGCLMIRRTRKI